LANSKRIKAAAPRKPRKYYLVTSEQLYALDSQILFRSGSENKTPLPESLEYGTNSRTIESSLVCKRPLINTGSIADGNRDERLSVEEQVHDRGEIPSPLTC
jgi:hypothetical protein